MEISRINPLPRHLPQPQYRNFARRRHLAIVLTAVTLISNFLFIPQLIAESGATSPYARSNAKFIALGFSHTCAILDDGNVKCWGTGTNGRLGYGNTTTIGDNETPDSVGTVALGAGRTATAITAGSDFSCVILDTGNVKCWGSNVHGQLGYGNTTTIGDNETPDSVGTVALGAGRTATAISSGSTSTCVILDTGNVKCWGNGIFGVLGYGNTNNIGDDETVDSVGTVALGAGRTATAISVAGNHTCVILDTGNVKCWGYGANGRLGYGNTTTIGDDETPDNVGNVDLGVGRTATAITAKGTTTCAVLDDDTVKCWGDGTYGQLGYGNVQTIGDNETPAQYGNVSISPGRTVLAISASGYHTCAILDDGSVKCWGYGLLGRLGYGNTNTIGDDESPDTVGSVELGVGRFAVAIATGNVATCVVLDDRTVRCWGHGPSGMIGSGSSANIGDDELPTYLPVVSLGTGRTAGGATTTTSLSSTSTIASTTSSVVQTTTPPTTLAPATTSPSTSTSPNSTQTPTSVTLPHSTESASWTKTPEAESELSITGLTPFPSSGAGSVIVTNETGFVISKSGILKPRWRTRVYIGYFNAQVSASYREGGKWRKYTCKLPRFGTPNRIPSSSKWRWYEPKKGCTLPKELIRQLKGQLTTAKLTASFDRKWATTGKSTRPDGSRITVRRISLIIGASNSVNLNSGA